MLHPRVGGLELMAVLENLARRLVEEPHPFIGQRGDRKRASQQGGENVLCHGAKVVKDREDWLGEVNRKTIDARLIERDATGVFSIVWGPAHLRLFHSIDQGGSELPHDGPNKIGIATRSFRMNTDHIHKGHYIDWQL